MKRSFRLCFHTHRVCHAAPLDRRTSAPEHPGLRSVGFAEMLCFYNVLQGVLVNCTKMRSVGIWAPRGGGTAAGRTREPMVSIGFPMIPGRPQPFLPPAEGAREAGTDGLRSIGIAEMLCFRMFSLISSLLKESAVDRDFRPAGALQKMHVSP